MANTCKLCHCLKRVDAYNPSMTFAKIQYHHMRLYKSSQPMCQYIAIGGEIKTGYVVFLQQNAMKYCDLLQQKVLNFGKSRAHDCITNP